MLQSQGREKQEAKATWNLAAVDCSLAWQAEYRCCYTDGLKIVSLTLLRQ